MVDAGGPRAVLAIGLDPAFADLSALPCFTPDMVRTYLDWLIELPWALPEEAPIDIAEARRILDADHYGLEEVKERILEFLAVLKLASEDSRTQVICFVGPPGVGKTSLGRSIAKAMKRKFVQMSLGGIRDEAEIPVRYDADELFSFINNRDTGDVVVRHEINCALNGIFSVKEEGIDDNAGFRSFDLVDFSGLFCDRHIPVNYSDAAFSRNCNCEA